MSWRAGLLAIGLLLSPLLVAEAPAAMSNWKYCKAVGYPTQYDKLIRKSVIKHWPLEWQVHHCGGRS